MPAAAKSSFRINVELNLQTRKAERPSETEWQNIVALEIPIHVNVKWHGKIWGEKENYILVHNF